MRIAISCVVQSVVVLVTAGLQTSHAQEQQQPPSQYEHVKVLEPFLGVWRGDFQPPGGPQGTMTLRCRWAANRSYLHCDILFRADDQPSRDRQHVATFIIGRHGNDERLHLWGFWPDEYSQAELSVDGTTLTYHEEGITVDGQETAANVHWAVSGDEMNVKVTDAKRGDADLPEMDFTLTQQRQARDQAASADSRESGTAASAPRAEAGADGTEVAAQAVPTTYAVVAYMRVPEDGEELYEQVEHAWRKVHQARKERGLIDAWAAFRVERPDGSTGDYSYVTVELTEDWADLENRYPQDLEVSFTPEEQQVMGRTGESRELIRQDLWQLNSVAIPERFGEGGFGPTLTFGFMKSTDPAHLEVEQQLWRRIWHEAAKDGHRWNWSLWLTRFPAGTEAPYNMIAVHTYPENAEPGQLPDQWLQETVPQLFQQQQLEQLKRTPELRELRVENWTIFESVGKD